MVNRWQQLCKLLAPFEIEEPALEGLRWILYKSSGILPSSNLFRVTTSQTRRWFLSKFSPQPRNTPLWYAIHGMIPAHMLPLLAVMEELAERGIPGQVIGPYPYKSVELETGWNQTTFDIGWPQVTPNLFHLQYRKARDYAALIYERLKENGFYSPNLPPNVRTLEMVIWNVLRLDWVISEQLKKWSPKVVVLGADVGPLRNPLTRHAKAQGVYTLVLQHGLQGDYAGSVTSDQVSLWGEYHRRKTIQLGASPHALVVDGSPRMDKILRLTNDPDVRKQGRKFLGISEKEPVLIHFLETIGLMEKLYPEIWDRFISDACQSFSKLTKKMVVIIRPHPGDPDTKVENLNLPGIRIVSPKDMDLQTSFASADIVSTTLSATGLEAAWCGLPVIYYQPSQIPAIVDFPALGGGIAVQNADEWIDVAIQLARLPKTSLPELYPSQEFLLDTLAYPGRGTKRVADRIQAHL